MRICLHDFAGHPFQAELARRLAERGHQVVHASAAEYVGGKGDLSSDTPNLRFDRIAVDRPFERNAFVGRLTWERAYASAAIDHLRDGKFDAYISCNIPLLATHRIARWARRHDVPWVFWHQDIHSAAMSDELHSRLPGPIATVGSRILDRMEAYLAVRAMHVVAIGEAFTEAYAGWQVASERVSVIPNWAPLDDIMPQDRDNHRAAALFRPDGGLRLLYAGNLGRKHNPGLLVELMRRLRENGVAAQLTVVSEGEAADDLRDADPDITVVDFQPADALPQVLGSADVLVALLEPDATRFSIPSKVLSYMAAGRPILGLMPADNPAAVDITEAGGAVGTPDVAGVDTAVAWVRQLDARAIEDIGRRARNVAERKFDVVRVTDRFEEILSAAT
ncbi:MAG TPA: glycosyltransferase family 4 protein [Aeromicrobium sp.]|nr:glycosyltransferase family 4 protein [Aeromicrobium sp.]